MAARARFPEKREKPGTPPFSSLPTHKGERAILAHGDVRHPPTVQSMSIGCRATGWRGFDDHAQKYSSYCFGTAFYYRLRRRRRKHTASGAISRHTNLESSCRNLRVGPDGEPFGRHRRSLDLLHHPWIDAHHRIDSLHAVGAHRGFFHRDHQSDGRCHGLFEQRRGHRRLYDFTIRSFGRAEHE